MSDEKPAREGDPRAASDAEPTDGQLDREAPGVADAAELEAAEAAAKRAGSGVAWVRCDLTDAAQVEAGQEGRALRVRASHAGLKVNVLGAGGAQLRAQCQTVEQRQRILRQDPGAGFSFHGG